jgi:hypothetical protein
MSVPPSGQKSRWRGYFGCDVLRSLITGIDEFNVAKARERRFLVLGSAPLGAFMWLDDPELVDLGLPVRVRRDHQAVAGHSAMHAARIAGAVPRSGRSTPRYQPLSSCRAMTMRWIWLVPS